MLHTISSVRAEEILDSRGNPTLRATVTLAGGAKGTASVPSGASTGEHEAHELRDGDRERFGGKGVLRAVGSVNSVIAPAISSYSAFDQRAIDEKMIAVDGTADKSRLGANAILAVSLAVAAAAADCCALPLYRYLGGVNASRLPTPMMNILNGGAHAGNGLDVQEFMIVPTGFANFRDKLRAGCEVYKALASVLKEKGLSTGVGDEGGFAPDIDDEEEALELMSEAVKRSGHEGQISFALDIAASEWKSESGYKLPKKGEAYNSEELCDKLTKLCRSYPIISVEDGMGEDDWHGWRMLTERLSDIMLVGDDLFVTNTERLRKGVDLGVGNAILIKPNQIGTLTETLDVIRLAAHHGYRAVISHRSGETADTFIADLAVATNSEYIKTGAPCRAERTEKYNRLLSIENEQ